MKYLLSLLLLVVGVATADVPLPDTPAGKIFAEYLVAFNSGDLNQLKRFYVDLGWDNGVSDRVQRHVEISGGMTLLRVEQSEPLKILVLLQEKETLQPIQAELVATGDSPPRIEKIYVKRTELPPDLAPARLPKKEALRAFSAWVDQRTKEDRFSGVVLIARGDQVLLQRAWGKSNRETGADNTVETQFRLGSQNKMFTSIAVLQLVEAGKLALNEPIGKHMPDYPNKDVASKVTVHHLLTHSGGTGDIFGPQFDANRLSLKEHSDYLKLYGARPPEFEPGSQDRYSNYGFVLLGALIEKVTGQSYDDYVRTRIFEPAGMRSTGALPENENVPRRSAGYMKENGKWVPNTNTLPYRGTSAGGGYSTASDMLRFVRALQSGKLISKKMLTLATSPQDHAGGYGYGFGLHGSGATRNFGHGGGAPGMNTELLIFPELGYVLIAMCNIDPMAARTVVDYYAARMPID